MAKRKVEITPVSDRLRLVLQEFINENTRPAVREKLRTKDSDFIGNAMNTLRQRGLIDVVHKRGDADGDLNYPVFVYKITEKGLKTLALTPAHLTKHIEQDATITHSRAVKNEFTSSERSVMNRPVWTPEKWEAPRGPESLAFKSIPSKGMR